MSGLVHLVWVIHILFLVLGQPMVADGLAVDAKNTLSIQQDEKVNHDIFYQGEGVEQRGIVVGDLLAFVQRMDHDGTTMGDVLGIFTKGDISGHIRGNLRVMAPYLTIKGEIDKNLTLYTKHVMMSPSSIIDGSMTFWAEKIKLQGDVGSDIRGVTDKFWLDGTIRGDVTLWAKSIEFGQLGKIKGDLTYYNVSELSIPGHRVDGEITFHRTSPIMDRATLKKVVTWLKIITKIMALYGWLFITMIWFGGVYKNKNKGYTLNKPIGTLMAIGLGGLIGTPILSGLLMLSVLGLPLGVLLMGLYGMVLYLAQIPAGLYLGRLIFRGKTIPMFEAMAGLTLLWLLSWVPYINKVTGILALIYGMGGFILFIGNRFNKEKVY